MPIRLVSMTLSVLILGGCVAVRVGTQEEESALRVEGLANGYVSLNGIRPYNGTLLELGLLTGSKRSHAFEVVSAEVWPVVGLGVGLAGVRVQLLFLDVGVGVLAYKPAPPDWSEKSPEAKEKPGEAATKESGREAAGTSAETQGKQDQVPPPKDSPPS